MEYIRRIINNAVEDGVANVLSRTAGRGQKQQQQQQQVCATSLATRTPLDDDDDDDDNATTRRCLTHATFVMEAAAEQLAFLPDFTEHPKPRRRPRKQPTQPVSDGGVGGGGDDGAAAGGSSDTPIPPEDDESDGEITFLDDFVAGGVAGCASVIVGHPFDT